MVGNDVFIEIGNALDNFDRMEGFTYRAIYGPFESEGDFRDCDFSCFISNTQVVELLDVRIEKPELILRPSRKENYDSLFDISISSPHLFATIEIKSECDSCIYFYIDKETRTLNHTNSWSGGGVTIGPLSNIPLQKEFVFFVMGRTRNGIVFDIKSAITQQSTKISFHPKILEVNYISRLIKQSY